MEEGGVIVIRLSNVSGSFTFTYDALRHTGTVVYPRDSRIERAWVAPTPVPTATPKPTAKPTSRPVDYYSEWECWEIAERYFWNIRWNNPSSVTIYSHTSTYDANDYSYTFYIDYSAQVTAGGYKRSYYFITVSAVTGSVTFAFGGD